MVNQPPWRHQAACQGRNTNYWYPDNTTPTNSPATQLALTICKTCPVITQCLNHAIQHPEYHGIWGGKTEQQRRGMRNTKTGKISHGTNAGYQQHAHWGIPPCQPCRQAHTQYQAARKRIRERAKQRHNLDDDDGGTP